MLSPDQIQDAGDAIAALYSDMEARMLDHLVDRLVEADMLGQRSITELNLLAQSMAPELQRIVDENREAISDEVYETCERLLSASDRDDARRLGADSVTFPAQLAVTAVGMQAVLDRDNLRMVEGAKQAFLKFSVEAVAMTNSGLYTAEQAIHKAVRNLTSEGIGVTEVTYRNPQTGAVTVTNKVDVAVRRHVRTQIAQDSGRMTLERLSGLDVALVEVSSHEGARPTHQAWEGRVYSLKGEVTIDGVRYRDFYSATGYGHVDGLLGANCRHSFGPYRHGAPRAYDPDPKHPSGLSNDEIYKLSQKQRYMERQIRAAKRNVMGARRLYEKEPSQYAKAELAKAQERLKGRQAAMRTLIKDANAKCKPGTAVLHRNPRREWAGDMPKAAKAMRPATMHSMKQPVSIDIDEFTPCLKRSSDGTVISTYTKSMNTKELPDKSSGWEFDWKAQSSHSNNIIGLYANGDQRLQGLVGLSPAPEMLAVHVELAESAPHNSKHNAASSKQEYTGVGPHLFAIAVKRSIELGYNGCIFFEAKTNLISHYAETLGAVRIGSSQRMIVDGEAAKRLYDTYYGTH